MGSKQSVSEDEISREMFNIPESGTLVNDIKHLSVFAVYAALFALVASGISSLIG